MKTRKLKLQNTINYLKFGLQEIHTMKHKELKFKKQKSTKAVCIGTGLVALDVIMNGDPNTQPKFLAGGSCGNILIILSFLGWKSYPVARLSNRPSVKLLFNDLVLNNIKLELISVS